jgi:quercetin dioxygenase-like cupin family protein
LAGQKGLPYQRRVARAYNGKFTEPTNNMEFFTWDEMEKEVLSPTIGRKIISGEKAMVSQVFLAKGAVVPEHHHESEQITYILEGALEFQIEGKTIVVGKGQVLLIPSNVPHAAVALEDTLDLDVFSPIRHDWLKKDDAYLRGGK